MNFADRLARLGVGRRRDGAGVYYHQVGGSIVGNGCETLSEKTVTEGRSVRVRSAAAEVFDGKCRHGISGNHVHQENYNSEPEREFIPVTKDAEDDGQAQRLGAGAAPLVTEKNQIRPPTHAKLGEKI